MKLMREAFKSEGIPVSGIEIEAERKPVAHLYAGAIGFFKNPLSYRDVEVDDAKIATSRTFVASEFLLLLDYHRLSALP